MTDLIKGTFPAMMKDPYADALTQPFWDAAAEGRLTAPRCTVCGTFVLPPQPFCFVCQSQAFEWVDLPGTGTIYTFTVVRHPLAPQLAEVVVNTTESLQKQFHSLPNKLAALRGRFFYRLNRRKSRLAFRWPL